ncbi:UNVERIFIED_CONTAM: hypothetical protein HDU68_007582 [Siphonaria sp. JEL0065]|nr:hypothetical protein HDU68_007582 [Siphonaria sp. JEL0065]
MRVAGLLALTLLGVFAFWARHPRPHVLHVDDDSNEISDDEFKGFVSPKSHAPLGFRVLSESLFTVTGFEFCHHLNNATFNRDTVIYNWPNQKEPAKLSTIGPTTREFVDILDEKARKATSYLLSLHPNVFSEESTKRFACYAVADGANMVSNLSDTRLLHRVDGINYFQTLLPAIIPQQRPNPQRNHDQSLSERTLYRHLHKDGTKRRYKIAYLLMVHGYQFQSIKNLVEVLDDGSAIFLIHIDDRSINKALQKDVASWIQARDAIITAENPNADCWDSADVPGNVFLAKTMFKILWGHGSIMWMQLNGFWELLDLADWDHLITLSANDYPLRESREIARVLKQPQHVGYNFIKHWSQDIGLAKRVLPNMHIKRPKFKEITNFHLDQVGLMSPPFPRWAYVKHHQWVIVTREFVEFTRNSPIVAHALAYFEHTLIPDESFLGTILKNTHFRHKISTSKRFLKFKKNQPHPEELKLKDVPYIGTDEIGADPSYLFVRKLNTTSVGGQELVEWIRKEHLEKHLRPEADYEITEGVHFVPKF